MDLHSLTLVTWITIALVVTAPIVAALATAHAVLYKRDSRSVIAWVGLFWLTPFVGVILYSMLGINRIRRQAKSLRGDPDDPDVDTTAPICASDQLAASLSDRHTHLAALCRLVGDVTQRPLLDGNTIHPLFNGDQAYPAMLECIEAAEQTITLSTYIFDNDRAGHLFVDALGRARRRGVEVRVLVDDVGARYSHPPIVHALRDLGVPVAEFLPTFGPRLLHYANLRSHRKMLVVDGHIGFAGGMNIREGCYFELNPAHPTQDLHFRIDGPAVRHIQEAFATDWTFTTQEHLDGPAWFPSIAPSGHVLARGITDGPDEDFEKFRLTILGAIATAEHDVRIMTPYFLPDSALITALNVAAMRGVTVDIVLPAENNLRLVQWACTAQIWQVLQRGCRVWLSAPPFDHTKVMIVDGIWTLIGSANWDPRSLRLNFEFNMECYCPSLATELSAHVDAKIAAGRRLLLDDVQRRSLPVRLRDGVARLALALPLACVRSHT